MGRMVEREKVCFLVFCCYTCYINFFNIAKMQTCYIYYKCYRNTPITII